MRIRFLPVVVAAAALPLTAACKKKEETPPPPPAAVPAPAAADLLQKGRAVFEAKCASCHKIQGAGGTAGPDLSKVGATRDALFIQTQLQDPKAYNRESKMPSFMDMPKEDKDALVAYLLTLK